MLKKTLLASAGLVLGIGLLVSAPASANLLTNGSFETGDLTGWTWTGNENDMYVSNAAFGYSPEDGNYFLAFGEVGSDGVLSQTFTDVAGGTLTVTGYLAGNGTG